MQRTSNALQGGRSLSVRGKPFTTPRTIHTPQLLASRNPMAPHRQDEGQIAKTADHASRPAVIARASTTVALPKPAESTAQVQVPLRAATSTFTQFTSSPTRSPLDDTPVEPFSPFVPPFVLPEAAKAPAVTLSPEVAVVPYEVPEPSLPAAVSAQPFLRKPRSHEVPAWHLPELHGSYAIHGPATITHTGDSLVAVLEPSGLAEVWQGNGKEAGPVPQVLASHDHDGGPTTCELKGVHVQLAGDFTCTCTSALWPHDDKVLLFVRKMPQGATIQLPRGSVLSHPFCVTNDRVRLAMDAKASC